MSKKTITTTNYVDDLDGSMASGTITFGWENTQYEIDLSKSNARAFEKTLKPYIEVARKVRGTRGKSGPKAKASSTKTDLSAVRSSAANNGFTVSNRGRIAADVVAAYEAAN